MWQIVAGCGHWPASATRAGGSRVGVPQPFGYSLVARVVSASGAGATRRWPGAPVDPSSLLRPTV
jgi:hypothetical protein